MLGLSSALSAALGAPVQQPAILAEIAFATARRYSSFATVSWNGHTWTKDDIWLEGLAVEALRLRGTLNIGNADGAIGSLVLAEGVADRAITLWGYDAAATGAADVVLLAEAAGAGARIGLERVSINLRAPGEFLLAPRTFVDASAGFTQLLPAGVVLNINGVAYRLDRR